MWTFHERQLRLPLSTEHDERPDAIHQVWKAGMVTTVRFFRLLGPFLHTLKLPQPRLPSGFSKAFARRHEFVVGYSNVEQIRFTRCNKRAYIWSLCVPSQRPFLNDRMPCSFSKIRCLKPGMCIISSYSMNV